MNRADNLRGFLMPFSALPVEGNNSFLSLF